MPQSKKTRPGKDRYYLDIARSVSKRSTCYRNQGGAIIVRSDQIVSTGYIGAPRKTKDCFERDNCLRDKLDIPHGRDYTICRSVHAEMNAIINAARAGVSLLEGTMYIFIQRTDGDLINSFPCFMCKRMIINAGLDEVVCSTEDGGMKKFKVEKWIQEWRKNDIVDDKDQYGIEYNDYNS